jgi:hypothetical protein
LDDVLALEHPGEAAARNRQWAIVNGQLKEEEKTREM